MWQVVLFLMWCCSLELLLMRARASTFEQIKGVLELCQVKKKYCGSLQRLYSLHRINQLKGLYSYRSINILFFIHLKVN